MSSQSFFDGNTQSKDAVGKRVLIIVENLTVPLDRRVWQEARSLRDAGYVVSVICPVGGDYQDRYEVLENIHIFRHTLPTEADTAFGYLVEYTAALFWEFRLAFKVLRKPGFDVIQACNPPDLIFIVGLFFKIFFRKKFIFDHHDINPELYEAKFGKRGFFWRLLLFFERLTFKAADASIATNQTFKDIAVKRGGMDTEKVFIVRSTPDASRFKRPLHEVERAESNTFMVGYVGIIGRQDGVDLLIHAIHHLVIDLGLDFVRCKIVGSGTEVDGLKQLSTSLGLSDHIEFTGFLSGDDLLQALSSFDAGVIPDPKNVYNDKISMNKVFEYMAMGVPFVQFDLIEGRRAAANAALYAKNNEPTELAAKLKKLIEEPELLEQLVENGRIRSSTMFKWADDQKALLSAYEAALA